MKFGSSPGVTFLFTDIEGSTRLWEQEPGRMQPALASHDLLCRAAVEASHGTLVKMPAMELDYEEAIAEVRVWLSSK